MIQEYNSVIKKLGLIVESTLKRAHFQIHAVYNVSNLPVWNIPERYIDDWMIVYARDGSGYYCIDNQNHPIEEGKIFFISNRVLHSATQGLKPISVIAVRFGIYDNFTEEFIGGLSAPLGFSFKVKKFYYYQQLFESIYSYFKYYTGDAKAGLCNALLCRIFSLLYMSISQAASNTSGDAELENARLFIDENILEDLSLDKVAEHVSLSPKYFSKLFHARFGLSFKKYVFEAKIRYAKLLLEETDFPIKKIALLLGYSDQYIFSNQFKKYFNISPSSVRKDKI